MLAWRRYRATGNDRTLASWTYATRAEQYFASWTRRLLRCSRAMHRERDAILDEIDRRSPSTPR